MRAITRVALVLCAGLLATERAWGAGIVIKLGTVAPEGSTWHDLLLRVKQDWRTISAGQVELRIYPGGVLGGEEEMVRKAQRRGLDAVALSGAGLPQIDKSVNCLNIPLLFESYAELDHVRDKVSPEIERRFEAAHFKVLNWSDAGWVHLFSRSPVRSPDDLRGLKLWTTSGDPDTERLFKDLRFQVVPLPATDLLTSLQTRLVEAVNVPPLFAMLDRTYKRAGYMTDFKWTPLVAATVIHETSWAQVPATLQAKLLEAARKAGIDQRAEIRRLGDEAVVEMKTRGLQVVELKPEEVKVWRDEVIAAWPRIRGGLVPPDLFDTVVKLRDEYRARNGKP